MIHDAKTEHWMDWLEHADKHTIWTVHHFITSPQATAQKHEYPTLKSSYPTAPYMKPRKIKTKHRHYTTASSSPPPPINDIDPHYDYPPLALPSRTLLMHRYTEPSNASNLSKAPGLTNNPTPSTYTAVSYSSHTSAHTIVPPST